MTEIFPSDPQKIRARIRSYERKLQLELDRGCPDDGYGKRFLLGPLYMLLNDVDGALASYEWFVEAYSDSGGDPYQYLMWSLALYRARRWEEANNKLYQTMLQNIYLIPHLLGDEPRPKRIRHRSNLAEWEYALDTPPSLLAVWNSAERAWARQLSQDPAVTERVARYIEISRELHRSPADRRYTALVNEQYRLERTALDRPVRRARAT